MKHTWLRTTLLVLAAIPAYGQTASGNAGSGAKAPAYDIGSIKPNQSGSGSSHFDMDNYRFTGTNVSLRSMLGEVYGVKPDLISGVPRTIDAARFDVTAKIVDPDPKLLENLTREQQRALLQPFLVDRFQLKVHNETRQLPVYELVVVKGGPKFKQAVAVTGDKGPSGTSIHNFELTAHAIPMSSLASSLFNPVHRTVIDKTGLSGKYDLTLKWSPEDSPDATNNTAPLILTALREQLGLKLQPAKGPVETLVVDHVEMPSAD